MTASFAIRRMLIAVDASPAARAALVAALRLAEQLQADAEGLFVEDARLLDLCGFGGLPTAHVSAATGLAESIDVPTMEAGLRAQADALKLEFDRIAASLNRAYRMRAVRGPVAATLVAEAAAGDLLIVGRRLRHVGFVLEETIRRASTSVLVLPERTALNGGCAILANDRATLEAGLGAALRLSGPSLAQVDLWLGPDLSEPEARTTAAALGMEIRAAAKAPADAAAFAGALAPDCALIVLTPDNPILAEGGLRAFLTEVGTPTLLLRDAPADA